MEQVTRTVQTTIRLPAPVWRKLRAMAEDRAIARGGRASVAAVVAQLAVEAAGRKAGRGKRASGEAV